MSKVAVSESNLTDIADSIRAKNGTQNTYTPAQMSNAIDNLPSGGDITEYIYDNVNTYRSNSNSNIAASLIKKIPNFTINQNPTDFSYMFQRLGSLQEIPNIDTSLGTKFDYMFSYCYALRTPPVLDLSNATSLKQMFYNCNSLTDQGLDNILQMCINANLGTKTLKQLGISNTTIYPASRIQALPHYQDFINAGWTIGY